MYEVSFGANAGGRYITTVSMVSLKPLAAYGRPTSLEGLASAPNNVFFFGPNLRFPAACGECIFRSWTCVSVLRVEGLSNELTACACQTFFVLCLVCSILTVVPVTYFRNTQCLPERRNSMRHHVCIDATLLELNQIIDGPAVS